jgi:hypothetical protein
MGSTRRLVPETEYGTLLPRDQDGHQGMAEAGAGDGKSC